MHYWKVELSNGEKFKEGIKPFEIEKGRLSPWLRLKNYLQEKNLKIVSLSLENEKEKSFNLPTLKNRPKFAEFHRIEEPKELNCFTKIGLEFGNNEIKEEFKVIEAIYNDYKLQLWLNIENSNCFVLVL
jgi:hypothetical protein